MAVKDKHSACPYKKKAENMLPQQSLKPNVAAGSLEDGSMELRMTCSLFSTQEGKDEGK